MVKYTLKLMHSEKPNIYGEYNQLVLKNVLGEEIPKKEDILDSTGIKEYIQNYDRLDNSQAYYYCHYGNSKFVVKNIEHFLTENNSHLEASTIVTAVKLDNNL